ncbi:cysteinyl-tRNA synthetase [Ferrithrix thermotolerans DSM 19514]|uniref:Cysteine--tRNA ligase n=1 Tax=Ferrithrix thermotolerans DSM 19514 TaxID=1121881 RepID=A0A1M4VM00_9ACTN|nr:cysteine--tRNA ligase [Ferrithrix thermotolerans]SHE69873.1 cysteinyl-tRNA synthetase [Ferrithrix thermotolerans DSM 19514]
MRIFDTKAREKVPLEVGETVRIYTCGITPYDAAHVGHAAVYLTFDILQRRLIDMGVRALCVRNVTDVDDDILRKARELDCNYLDLAASEMAKFDANMAALGVLACYSEPRATSAIPEILSLISDLFEKGHAYEVGGWVYFDVTTFADFGGLSHYHYEEMITLSAERGADPDDPRKRNPLDFVLWQPSAPGEPSWESRYGAGRPGWHIECSALAMRELGETIDIHGGGSDLIFPHHECEIAQSESATGKTFSRYWMHVGMVNLDGIKMSKSLGNLVFVGDLLKRHSPGAVRLAIASNHYKSSWDFSEGLVEIEEERLARWKRAGAGSGALDEVRAHLDDDLDVKGAVSAIDEAVSKGQGVSTSAALLGVTL